MRCDMNLFIVGTIDELDTFGVRNIAFLVARPKLTG